MVKKLKSDFLRRIQFSLKKKRNIKLHEPKLFNDTKNINECINKNFVAIGKHSKLFEDKLKKITKSKYVTGVSSGTAGLHLALKSIGIRENDEVFVPALTFVATANSIKYLNAIPHFVDSNEKDLGVDVEKFLKYLNSKRCR